MTKGATSQASSRTRILTADLVVSLEPYMHCLDVGRWRFQPVEELYPTLCWEFVQLKRTKNKEHFQPGCGGLTALLLSRSQLDRSIWMAGGYGTKRLVSKGNLERKKPAKGQKGYTRWNTLAVCMKETLVSQEWVPQLLNPKGMTRGKWWGARKWTDQTLCLQQERATNVSFLLMHSSSREWNYGGTQGLGSE